MRRRFAKYDKKLGCFTAYTKMAERQYIASPEMAEMLGWHFYAETDQEFLAEWLKYGRDDPRYQEVVEEARLRLGDCDAGYNKARKHYWATVLHN